ALGCVRRVLVHFPNAGLLERGGPERDGREQLLSLTPRGQATVAPLEAGAREQIGAMLDHLPAAQQQRLVQAMGTIELALGEPAAGASDCLLRQPRPGDMGWVIERP